MLDWFQNLNYCLQALLATIFTWSITLLGASLVFLFKRVNRNFMDAMLGFAAGVMIAASFWSLLLPAIDMAESLSMIPWVVCFIGFFTGGLLLFISDRIFYIINKRRAAMMDSNPVMVSNHQPASILLFSKLKTRILRHYQRKRLSAASVACEGSCEVQAMAPMNKKRCFMLILSITMHNIPEGMAVGVAFGSLAYHLEGATFPAACLLALGIGLQNFPEGTAVSVPLRRDGLSRAKAFFYGQLSGIVEPIAGVIGAFLVLKVQYLLPFLLAFAAGAMIYVVIEELVPESQSNSHKELMALATLVGFSVMMILDVSLG